MDCRSHEAFQEVEGDRTLSPIDSVCGKKTNLTELLLVPSQLFSRGSIYI